MARAPRLPAAERKRRIIRSAREVFAASGYGKVSTADLASAADVSEPALYRYFPGKKALFISTLKATAPELLDTWHRIAAEVQDPLETLWHVILSYYDHLKSRSAAMKLQFQAIVETDDPEIRKALRQNFAAFIQFFRDVLEDGKRRGIVRPEVDAGVVAWELLGTGITLDVLHMLGFEGETSRQKTEVWARLLLDSLRSREPAAGLQPLAAAAVPYDYLPPPAPLTVGQERM